MTSQLSDLRSGPLFPGLVILCLCVAFPHIGGPTNYLLVAACLVLLFACAWLLWPRWSGQRYQWGIVHWLMLAYVGWLVVLLYTSTLPDNSYYFAWMLSILPVVAITMSGLSEAQWRAATLFLLLPALVFAGWGFVEYLATSRRPNGPIFDPSSFVVMCNLMFFIVLSSFLSERDHSRAGLWIWALVLVVLLVLALGVLSGHSRVGTVLFLLATSWVLGCLGVARYRYGSGPPFTSIVSILVIVTAAFVFVSGYAGQEEAAEHGEGYTIDLQQDGWSQRFAIWRGALRLYQEYPVFGAGPGTFKVHDPRFRDEGDLRNFGNFVHNDYLQYLAEGGPVLLFFLLMMLGWVVYLFTTRSWQILTSGGDPADREVLVLVAGVGALMAHALMNFALFHLQVQILLGLVFGRMIMLVAPGRSAAIHVDKPVILKGASVVVVALLSVVLVLDAISEELVFQQGAIPVVRDIREDPVSYYETMVTLSTLRSNKSANRIAMATLYRQSFDQFPVDQRYSLGLAVALEYKAGLELNPWHDRVRGYFADFLEQNPEYQRVPEVGVSPEALYREGARLTPVYIEAWLSLAFYLERVGREDEAYRLLVDEALPWLNLQHGDYHRTRNAFMKALLSRARAREDNAVLRELLDRID
ncbi:MAG: O-antigen ligase family protein [Pseudomonadota bacterium]